MRAVTPRLPLHSIHSEMPITLLGKSFTRICFPSCFSLCLVGCMSVAVQVISCFFFPCFLLADSSHWQRRPWQSSFQRLQELLSIGSRCLGWRLFSLIIFLYASIPPVVWLIVFCKHFFSHLNESFKFIGSLVRIRLGSLPFHKGAVEWQLEPAVL